MRVTRDTKRQTRKQILAAAKAMFRRHGFDAATTRDIARESGVAAGTLFNYFDSKEEIAFTLLCERVEAARADFLRNRRADASLDEELFSLIAAELRRLKPLRKLLHPVFETTIKSPVPADRTTAAAQFRGGHLDVVEDILKDFCRPAAVPPMALQLYWTLYTGVLSFWCEDRSRNQEDTLALLDQSLRMYVLWMNQEMQT